MKKISVNMKKFTTFLLAPTLFMILILPISTFGQQGSTSNISSIGPQAAPVALTINTVTIDYSTNTATIVGQNFGSTVPALKLAGNTLTIQSFNATSQT